MANEKNDVAAKRKRRQRVAALRRLKIFSIVTLIISVLTLVILSLTVFFPIKTIKVTGSKLYSSEQIREKSELQGENLIVTSERKLEKRLRKAFPYIDSVTLKKDIPDGVSIKITEAKEYAAFQSDGTYYIVRERGYVLKTQNTAPKELFVISANIKKTEPGSIMKFKSKRDAELAKDVVNSLKKQKIEINSVDCTSKINITARVVGRFDVKFGDDSYLSKKCAHLKTMLKSIEADAYGSINLTVWTPEDPSGILTRKTEKEISEKLLSYLAEYEIKVDSMDASNAGAIKAQLAGKFSVNFGADEYLKEKCEYLKEFMELNNEGGTIDMSEYTPNSPNITFNKEKE